MTNDVYRSSDFRRTYVDTAEKLHQAISELGNPDALGVDLEMGQRVHRLPGGRQEWKHILALIQLASDGLSVLVDPLRCGDLSALRPLLAGATRKVFLGGGQDVALLEQSRIPARNIVDVGEIALGVFGRREDGMAALSRRIFGISLDKTVRRADWMVRPLNPTLLSYAYRDAELTLMIYRWFQAQYPEVVRLHEREHLDPPLDASTPVWLKVAVTKPSTDALAIVMSHGMDRERDAIQLSRAIARALAQATAPRVVNRLVRIATDLELRDVLPEILPLTQSSSSIVRSSAARALGQLGIQEEVEGLLRSLTDDPIEEVRKSATAALKDAAKPAPKESELEPEEPASSLDENSLAALRTLLAGEAEATQ